MVAASIGVWRGDGVDGNKRSAPSLLLYAHGFTRTRQTVSSTTVHCSIYLVAYGIRLTYISDSYVHRTYTGGGIAAEKAPSRVLSSLLAARIARYGFTLQHIYVYALRSDCMYRRGRTVRLYRSNSETTV